MRVVAVLTIRRRDNEVRGHRTGSKNSGVEEYLRRETHMKEDITHSN